TEPTNLGAIFCGFIETLSLGAFCPSSGDNPPANIRQKVVLPVPFSPIITIISESEKSPASIFNLKSPIVLVILLYWKSRVCSIKSSSVEISDKRNCRDSVRKRKFSVGM
ncbi:hypothetical protein NADFUDRAFT_26880, partial [Nadsonia fulvescens var. elongata DSM 6958]